MDPAGADIIGTSAFISSRSQKVEEDYRKDAYNASYGIRLNSSQPRHPGRAITPYPGSQNALAFVTIPGQRLRRFRDDTAKSSTGFGIGPQAPQNRRDAIGVW
jgi:hypothetical protein